jgi:hypothetical protein
MFEWFLIRPAQTSSCTSSRVIALQPSRRVAWKISSICVFQGGRSAYVRDLANDLSILLKATNQQMTAYYCCLKIGFRLLHYFEKSQMLAWRPKWNPSCHKFFLQDDFIKLVVEQEARQ